VIIGVAFLIGIPVLSFINDENLAGYEWSLTLMLFAGVLGGGCLAFSMLLTIMRQLKIQVVIFVVTFIVGIIASVFFVGAYGIYGAFISFAIMNMVQLILFLSCYVSKYKRYRELMK